MSSNPPPHESQLLEAMQEERRLAEALRAAWLRGDTPSLAQFVRADSPSRLELLLELAATDLACRLERGQAACAEMYLRRWPELGADKEVLVELIRREWQARAREDEAQVRAELAERFPEVASSIAGLPAPTPPPSWPSTAPDGPPDGGRAAKGRPKWPRLPGYEILGELGVGGMGIVSQARQVGAGRVVALKMIRPGLYAGPDHLARFRREAEATARLQHPNIVQILDVSESAGQPYFSLEYCGGGSLAEKLAGQPLVAREAARLMEQIAAGIQAAHQKGVIHRDLKPGNVLLTDNGTPKVADFGLARWAESDGTLTGTGLPIGTPQYMAPEQAAGRKDVGPAADVWALGVILYECLTGRPPFRGATHTETLKQVAEQEPVPPRQLNAGLPRDLETVALKCLRKDPAGRYATAADLAADLKRWQAGEPISARPVGKVEKAVKWVRRRPTQAGLLASIALLAVATAGLVYYMWRDGQARSEAREDRDRSLYIADLMTGRYEDPLALDGGVYPISKLVGDKVGFTEVLRRAAQKAEQQLRSRQEIQASAFSVVGSGFRTLGDYDNAERYLTRALSYWRGKGKRYKPHLATTLHLLGLVHHERGRYSDYETAHELYREALAISTSETDQSDLAEELQLTIGWLYFQQEAVDKAIKCYRSVLNAYPPNRVKDRRYCRAELAVAAVGAEANMVGNESNPLVVQEMLEPIKKLLELEVDESWKEIIAVFGQATIKMKELATSDLKADQARNERAAAEALLNQCVRLIRKSHGQNHFYLIFPLFGLAESMAKREDWVNAAEKCRECLDALNGTTGLGHDKAPYFADRYARILYMRDNKNAAGAEIAFNEVLRAIELRVGTKHHIYANALISYASFYHYVATYHDPGMWKSVEEKCTRAKAIFDAAPLGNRYRHYRLCEAYLADARKATRRRGG